MTVETVLTKRKALYQGELGFFPSNPVSEDDIAPFTLGGETIHVIREDRKIEALKFLWGLVHKTADNSDRWLDKDEAMKDLKMRARFAKFVRNRKGEMELRPKSLTRIDNEALRLLTEKIMDIICAEVLPGMKKNDLRKEIEEMLK
jgi:hypothetical protein